MRALFGRKMTTLYELKKLTKLAKEEGLIGSLYVVIREVILSDQEFKTFSGDLLADQSWILKSDGGSNEKGELRCVRVINKRTGEKFIFDSEGYDYARYTAIEE